LRVLFVTGSVNLCSTALYASNKHPSPTSKPHLRPTKPPQPKVCWNWAWRLDKTILPLPKVVLTSPLSFCFLFSFSQHLIQHITRNQHPIQQNTRNQLPSQALGLQNILNPR
jgi:hypothetical protein